MDEDVKAVIRTVTEASDQERMAFPAVVEALMKAGIERYHTDLVRATKTYYLPDGGSHEMPAQPVRTPPAQAFSAEGVEAAVRAVQAGTVGYGAFCERIAAAGCVGYFVILAGRRAVYYGRTGDSHTEWFPGAR